MTKMNISKTDYVLEIGSGDNPHPRANVLVDKYLNGDIERGGNIVIDRPLIVADMENLPIQDKAFDYVICRHVLEHLEDPQKGLLELMRVAKKGYIESPSLAGEIMFGWSFHKWVLALENGKLIFTPKTWKNPLDGIFHNLLKKDILFKLFFKGHRDLFYTTLEWNNEIIFEIRKSNFTQLTENKTADYIERKEYEKDHKTITAINQSKKSIKRAFGKALQGKSTIRKPIAEWLKCGNCGKTKFDVYESKIICMNCKAEINVFD